jgi:voltage-gated potassium channel
MKSQTKAERFVSRNRFVLLFGVLVAFYVLTPIVHQLREGLPPALAPTVERVLFLTLLLGTVASVSKGRAWALFALVLAGPATVLWFVGAIVASVEIDIIRHLLLILFLGYVIWVMLRVIFDSRQVTFNTLCASLCVYLLLGLMWALAYSAEDLVDPAAFTNTVAADTHPSWMRVGGGETTVLYFSFATLTTLGYGDIVPTSPISRMLASSEAITGQLYLAVLVARLVGMHIVHSMGQNQARGRGPGDDR